MVEPGLARAGCGLRGGRGHAHPPAFMGRKLRWLVFALGLVVLALLVAHVGVQTIVSDAARVGRFIVLIVLVYLPVYALNALAWRMTMASTGARQRPSYRRTLGLLISGFSLNYLTPVLALGGEPFRIASIAPWLGRRRAVASVASYFLLHALANVLIWLTALFVALAVAPWPTAIRIAVGVLTLGLLGAVAIVFRGLRRGVFEDLLDVGNRIPLVRRLVGRANHRRAALARIDAHMAAFYAASPPRFFAALALEYVARAISMAEFWLIFLGLGVKAGYLDAFVMGALTSLIMNVVFFVPLEVGTKEGALFVLAGALGLPFGTGVTTSLISRVREIIWAGVGVALVPLVGVRRAREHRPARAR